MSSKSSYHFIIVKGEQMVENKGLNRGCFSLMQKREKKVVSTSSRVPSGKNNGEENESQHLRDINRMSTVS